MLLWLSTKKNASQLRNIYLFVLCFMEYGLLSLMTDEQNETLYS